MLEDVPAMLVLLDGHDEQAFAIAQFGPLLANSTFLNRIIVCFVGFSLVLNDKHPTISEFAYEVWVKTAGGQWEPERSMLSPHEVTYPVFHLRHLLDGHGAFKLFAGGFQLFNHPLWEVAEPSVFTLQVVAIMLTSGLRKSEVCGLKTSNLNLDEGFFTVIGKGDKEALIHLSTEVQPLIADWIASKGEPTSHVFNAISRGGRVLDRPLSTSGMSYILDTVAKDTGVARFAPHDTRRTYATNMFAAGHDPLTVRDMMRHASVETTEIYNIKNDEKLKEVATTFRILAPE